MKFESPHVLDAQRLMKKIESFGYKAYIAGGAVRDLLLGEEPKDIDIATNCPVELLEREFSTHDIGKSKDFGTLTIRSLNLPGVWYDVSQFRLDGKYSDGRHPDKISLTSSFEEDVKRRDFTVNALGLSSDLELIDHVGGLKDLEQRIIRAVGDPIERFQEDKLRMMRAARFAAKGGFSLDKATKRAAKRLAGLITSVTPDRIRMELVKAGRMSGMEFARFILFLDKMRLLHRILPEVDAMKYFRHDFVWHPEGVTVFDHTIKCLETMTDELPISKIAALLHDIGKCVRFQEKRGWKLSYHTHENASAEMIKEIAERLHFSLFNTEALVYSAKNHMKFQDLVEMKPSKIARMVSSEHFSVLLDVARADEFSRGEVFATRDEFESRIRKAIDIKDKWQQRLTDSKARLVDGKFIMEVTGLNPSPMVGKIKKAVEDAIIDSNIDPTDLEKVKGLIVEFYEQFS